MSKHNPSPCCGILSGCCENRIPDVVKATLTDVSGCPALDGVEIDLIYDGSAWRGSKGCGSELIQLSLICTTPPGSPSPPDCNSFSLSWDLGCSILSSGFPTSCQCEDAVNPLSLVYKAEGAVTALCTCCDELAIATVQITITEA